MVEKNNQTIAFNVLYTKGEGIYQVYIYKNKNQSEKNIVLSMIPNGKG